MVIESTPGAGAPATDAPNGTVVQNPYMYGYKSVEVLNEILKGNASVIPASKFIDIPARQIRKDNVDAFWADLKEKVGGK